MRESLAALSPSCTCSAPPTHTGLRDMSGPIHILAQTVHSPFAPCPPLNYTHHAGQGQEGGLHLGVVGVLEQVICLKDVMGLHPVLGDGLDEVAYVLQLEGSRRQSVVGVGVVSEGLWRGVERWKEPGLTWCQFCVDSLIFFTEPGWSLLMNLKGAGERSDKGDPHCPTQAQPHRVRGQDDLR